MEGTIEGLVGANAGKERELDGDMRGLGMQGLVPGPRSPELSGCDDEVE